MKKTSRTFKRFAAITSASLLAACMVAPMASFAETEGGGSTQPTTYTITINANDDFKASNHTFKAYQIFTGTLNADTNATGFVGGEVNWGSSISDKAAFITALQGASFGSDEINAAMDALVADAGDTQSSAYDVALAIEKITSSSDKNLLAKTIAGLTLGEAAGTSTANNENGSATINNLGAGYYIVKDETTIGNGDASSRFILKLTDNTPVTIKTDAPTLEKKIWHNDGGAPTVGDFASTEPTFNTDVLGNGWADVGDNQIGDTIYYVIKTAVPDMSQYDTYKYIIHDEMDDGLTMGEVSNIVYFSDAEGATAVVIDKTNKVQITGNDFKVDFGDLKTVLPNANGGYIYTYYTAILNADAEVSASANATQNNPNTAYLVYSNNPNVSGSGDTGNTGQTAPDTVYDWTYTFNASKVDEKGAALPGATFELRENSEEGAAISLVEITDVDDLKVNGITELDPNTKYFRIATSADTNGDTSFTSEKVGEVVKNNFVFIGLDDTKTYTLVETNAPADYNEANPVDLTLSNSYEKDTPSNPLGSEVTEITYKVDGTASPTGATIINRKGTSLPGTGGIGTTVFYLGGGAMVAVAGIYLISKKRMKNTQE
ncbi:MAG: isopeptide-forming domain-containing fimbrial protein [Ruminococcus sp.]|nr:isopeptide-forming domain-containing fimbrial protein [Ruminococcus sp.]